MDDYQKYYCPAMEIEISEGACWEYCFADNGGPTDTTNWLKKWITTTGKFETIADFHKVCKDCKHCQWDT